MPKDHTFVTITKLGSVIRAQLNVRGETPSKCRTQIESTLKGYGVNVDFSRGASYGILTAKEAQEWSAVENAINRVLTSHRAAA